MIVSFDLWDTIIKRKCHPEEIKLFTCNYIFLKYNNYLKDNFKDIYSILLKRNEIEFNICKENKEKGFDDECRILDVFKQLKVEIFKDNFNNNKLEQELLNVEIEHEKKSIYINPDILPIFEKYKETKKIIISDFYMSSENIREILNSLNINVKFDKIYSSADELLNKKSSKLFKKVRTDLNIKNGEQIHIGDNEYSDIEIPKSMGIETIKMERKDGFDFSCKRGRNIDIRLSDIKIIEKNNKDVLYNLGIDLSFLYYFFIQDIINYSIINNNSCVYYLTREGETFIKLHEFIKENSPFGLEIPNCKLLEVSRIATFAPSLEEFSIENLLRLWSQYRSQSLKALFKTLNINIKNYIKFINKYNIDVNKNVYEPWFYPKFQKLFKDEEFLKNINIEIKEKREKLLNFFANKGIYNNSEPLFLVDIGWRGTIQDNLAYIFDKKIITGYYYTLFDFYNLQRENVKKYSFVDNNEFRDKIMSSLITLFEMLFNPDSGSVIGYDGDKAIRKYNADESNIVKNYTSYIQKGMFEGSKVINEYLFYHPFEMREFKEYVFKKLVDIKENPPMSLLNVYYNLVHNDTFGTGEFVDKKINIRFRDRINIFKVRNKIRNEFWKEAYVKYNHFEFQYKICKFFSNIKRKIRRK